MKWRITWWIHASGRLHGGSDVIEASEDFGDVAAEALIQEDLNNDLEAATISSFTPNLSNFLKKHRDLTEANKHSEISNWGIITITRSRRQ